MMEIKPNTSVSVPGTLFATQRSPGHCQFPHGCLVSSWSLLALLLSLLGILATRRPCDCSALSLTTRRSPGRISRKQPKTIDVARESSIFRHAKPSVYALSLAVKCVCCVDVCREVMLELWKLSLRKTRYSQPPHPMEMECPHLTGSYRSADERACRIWK